MAKAVITGRIALLAAAGLLAVTASGAAAFAAAQDEHPADGGTRRVERVIVMTDDHRAEGEGPRQLRILDSGDDRDCTRSEVNDEGRERTRVVVCTRGGGQLALADRAEKLERVLERIQKNDDLSAEHKERVTAALREAIDRLRNTH